LALAGLGIGTLASLLGLGGGFLIVPLLVLVFHLAPHHAVGTSLATVSVTAISAALAYQRQHRLDPGVGLITAALSIPGATLGAYLTTLVEPQILRSLFGLVLLFFASNFLRRALSIRLSLARPDNTSKGWHRRLVDPHGEVFDYYVRLNWVPLLFGAGLLSGFLGIGGGILVVTTYTLAMGIPIHVAVATSMFTMIFTALAGLSVHISLANVIYSIAIPLAVGTLIGSQLGARLARRLSWRGLEAVFGSALIVVALLMILR
jgi:hypothetical protein